MRNAKDRKIVKMTFVVSGGLEVPFTRPVKRGDMGSAYRPFN